MIGSCPPDARSAMARARALSPSSLPFLLLALVAGCTEVPAPPPPLPSGTTDSGGTSLSSPSASSLPGSLGDMDLMKQEILKNVLQLIGTAATRPGGANITIATENLNQYFKGSDPQIFKLPEPTRAYLTKQLEGLPIDIAEFDAPYFQVKDARHLEDCLMYHDIAVRVARGGSTLDRVRRLFDWTVQQVALVPAGALIPPQLASQGLEHVPGRPYDVLSRGLATEEPGTTWSERSWVFLALCRQIGLDAGLIAFDLPKTSDEEEQTDRYNIWCAIVLIDGQPYLFDTVRGIELTNPDGSIATLEQAATNPAILDRLDLPGQQAYPVHSRDLQGKVRVLIDSSKQYFAPRMRLLQADLAGGNRMILFRDPIEQQNAFQAALGDRLLSVDLWDLPLNVEYRLFNDPGFVRSTQLAIALFTPELPLLGARLLQLRGDIDQAKQAFVQFRFKEALPLGQGGEMVRLPPEVKRGLDLHSTYFLAMCHLEQGNPDEAAFLLGKVLDLAPTPTPGLLATLYGWGANTTLGRIHEAAGQRDLAILHYGRSNPTPDSFGNLVRARDLLWTNPFQSPDPNPSADSVSGSSLPSDPTAVGF